MAVDLSPLGEIFIDYIHNFNATATRESAQTMVFTVGDGVSTVASTARSQLSAAAIVAHSRVVEASGPLVLQVNQLVMPQVRATLGDEMVQRVTGAGQHIAAFWINIASAGAEAINESCTAMEPWQIVMMTIVTLILSQYAVAAVQWIRGLTREKLWKFVFSLPIVRTRVAAELETIREGMVESLVHPSKNLDRFEALPAKGLSYNEIIKQVNEHNSIETIDWRKGRISGTVYNANEELTKLVTAVWGKTAWSNPLHPDVFLGVRKMDAEVVSMVRDMYHGSREEACGTTTSGGTESIIMAVRAHIVKYRNRTSKPEIIVSDSVHAAFDKACEYFGAKLVKLPVGTWSRVADVRAYRRAINKNTVLIVGSAPSFAHGVIDPITELGELALRYNVGLHVDACLGGFLIPFMREAGFKLPPFDFRVKGVTSISCDTHKYGFAPKGNSVVLYNSRALRQCQYFTQPNWTGGVYASPTIAGSRSGATIAASWAALVFHGRAGYVETTRQIVGAAYTIRDRLRKIKGVQVCGNPLVSVVAIRSSVFDIYKLQSYLNERKWNMNALQFPASIHIACTSVHTPDVVEDFLADIAAGVKEILKNPGQPNSGAAAVYGTAAAIPDRSMISRVAAGFCDTLYDIPNDSASKKTE